MRIFGFVCKAAAARISRPRIRHVYGKFKPCVCNALAPNVSLFQLFLETHKRIFDTTRDTQVEFATKWFARGKTIRRRGYVKLKKNKVVYGTYLTAPGRSYDMCE